MTSLHRKSRAEIKQSDWLSILWRHKVQAGNEIIDEIVERRERKIQKIVVFYYKESLNFWRNLRGKAMFSVMNTSDIKAATAW